MDKLYQTMNKKMLQLRIDADNKKSRCCWYRGDGIVMATDGYIGYILPERECYIRFTEDGHLSSMPVQVHEVLSDNLLSLKDLFIAPDGMYYKTPDPEIYINRKKADLFGKDCEIYWIPKSRGVFVVYYAGLPVGIIMGKRIKQEAD